MARREINATHLVLLAGVAWLCLQAAMMQPTSSDLLALWLAATAMAQGAPDMVYAADTVFTMRPPPQWVEMATAAGYSGPVYPYIYPPIWAALLAPLTDAMSFGAFARAMVVINVGLIAGMCALAWRATGRGMPLPAFLFAGLAVIHLSYAGAIAVNVGQPQIVVAFLTVMAIERLQTNRQIASGAALALAAAIKLYPLFYVVVYVARGDWRALGSFALTGAALGLLSLGLGGWPLHMQFLSEVSAVSKTAITLPLSFSLDGIVAQIAGIDRMVVQTITPDHHAGAALTAITAKSVAWSVATKLAVLSVLAAAALAFRARPRNVLLWPVMMIALSLLSPLAWGYHFMAALAFAPALIPRWGLVPTVALFAPLCVLLLDIDALRDPLLENLSVIGAGVMAGFALACVTRPGDFRLPRRRLAPR